MEDPIALNRAHWDEVVPLHVASEFYDVASFKAGRSALLPVELAELGDVRGKTMLHLQCHFGMDTLSWARAGAVVTGMDFSGPAIEAARALAAETSIEVRFIESDVYKLPEVLDGTFDIVFASYGVICWLPDFASWARIAASYVKPGGTFYLVDFHGISWALDDAPGAGLSLKYAYLPGAQQDYPDDDGSYAARDAKLEHRRIANFAHPPGEVVSSLIDAGLRIEFLHEFPFAASPVIPAMTKSGDGYYRLPDNDRIPFMMSVRATKPV
jgi:SAM-dependent methyltransferase